MPHSRFSVIDYRWLALAGLLLAAQAGALWALGQPWISTSGRILLWSSNPLSPETSQQIADWYSLSHIVHGFLFYALLHFLCPKLPLGARLVLAMGLEIGWEVAENTPMVIEAYRKQALAIGYAGDSILNSLVDTLMAVLGFLFAARAPAWVTVAAGIGMEVLAALVIRDGLVLNILNFLFTIPFIERWQKGYALTALFPLLPLLRRRKGSGRTALGGLSPPLPPLRHRWPLSGAAGRRTKRP